MEWIPVSERLPDDGQTVVTIWQSVSSADIAIFREGKFCTDYGEVWPTHWMPLPEPPNA